MKAYIRGIGNISPQQSWETTSWPLAVTAYDSAHLHCIEPNYKEYINPVQMRRMSRILKMGVAAAGKCLRDADLEVPDAIIAGTGLGMMGDTEKFLVSLIENAEQLLTPTAFIQSTHNTVGAHIAVMLKCNTYNLTYVNDTTSFECAMLDSLMHVSDHPGDKVLLAGIDEMTEAYYRIALNAGYWKKDIGNTLRLLEHGGPGSIAGEGASFFVLSGSEHPGNYARIEGVHTFYRPKDDEETMGFILKFLSGQGLGAGDVDLLITGMNGDSNGDEVYHRITDGLFPTTARAYYKHLCGEYYTASAFATWLAAMILKKQDYPAEILYGNTQPPGRIGNILIYNQNHNTNHALILLTAC
jgi:3-oxoacyl-(acyl-carrier-protein) synthase